MASGYDLSPLRWGVDKSAEGYLLEAMQNLGWCQSGGMDAAPLSWAEIKAYADCTRDLSEPWEFQTLRDMSMAYLRGYRADLHAEDPAVQPRHVELGIAPIVHVFDRDVARMLVADADAEMDVQVVDMSAEHGVERG